MFKKKILAIVPARSGSQRLKNKNILKIKGKPLIYFTIREAKKVQNISKILVSTNSRKIVNIAAQYGVPVPFLRPNKISKNNSSMLSVIKHAINFYEKKGFFFDYILLLQPTSPIRKSFHIKKAIHKISKNKSINGLVSIEKAKPLQWMGRIDLKGRFLKHTKNQRKEANYVLNGAIYIFKSSYIKKQKKNINLDNKILTQFMNRPYSIDIDEIDDFNYAKYLIEKKRY